MLVKRVHVLVAHVWIESVWLVHGILVRAFTFPRLTGIRFASTRFACPQYALTRFDCARLDCTRLDSARLNCAQFTCIISNDHARRICGMKLVAAADGSSLGLTERNLGLYVQRQDVLVVNVVVTHRDIQVFLFLCDIAVHAIL